MMFATVSGNPTEAETEEITGLWQSMLYNANIEITRWFESFSIVSKFFYGNCPKSC